MPFDQWLFIMKRPWVIFCFLVMVTLCILYVDRPIAYYFHSIDIGRSYPIIKWITLLGSYGPYVIFLFLLSVFFRLFAKNKNWSITSFFLWLCVVIPAIICTTLKIVLGRTRPELLFTDNLYGFYGFKASHAFWSFPSGHTTSVMGLALGLSIVFPKYRFAYLSIAMMVALTRIILTDHYLSDVLIAIFLTFYEVALINYVWKTQKGWLK